MLHYPKIASFQVIFVVKVFLIKSMSEVTQWIYDKSGSHYACKTKGPTEFKKSWNKSKKKGRNPFLSSGGPALSLPSLGLGTICPKNGKWAYDDHPCHIVAIRSTMRPYLSSSYIKARAVWHLIVIFIHHHFNKFRIYQQLGTHVSLGKKNWRRSKSVQLLLLIRVKARWSENRAAQGFQHINSFISNS